MNTYHEGDIYYSLSKKDGLYYPFKILKLEDPPPGYHIALFEPMATEPSPQALDQLKIFVMHVPVAELEPETKFLANVPVQEEELLGYYTYLNHMHGLESGEDAN